MRKKGPALNSKVPIKPRKDARFVATLTGRNRNADKFKCTRCAFEENADIVGAINLKALGLAGVYSLRSLQAN